MTGLRSPHATPIDPQIAGPSSSPSTSTPPIPTTTAAAAAAAAISPPPHPSAQQSTSSSTDTTTTRHNYPSPPRSTNLPAAPSLYHPDRRSDIPADANNRNDDAHAATRRAAEAAEAAVAVAAAAARAQDPAATSHAAAYTHPSRPPHSQALHNGHQAGMEAVVAAVAVAGEDGEAWSGPEGDDDGDGGFDGLGDSRKRKRPVSVSCELCKHRKVKCDRGQPSCGWCLRNRQPCEYKERKKPGLRAGYGRELEARLDRLEEIIRVQAAAIAKLSGGTIQTMPLSPPPTSANAFNQQSPQQPASTSRDAAVQQQSTSPTYRYRNGFVLPVEPPYVHVPH